MFIIFVMIHVNERNTKFTYEIRREIEQKHTKIEENSSVS